MHFDTLFFKIYSVWAEERRFYCCALYLEYYDDLAVKFVVLRKMEAYRALLSRALLNHALLAKFRLVT